jgi:CBS-domain-containing membrane protein
MYFHYYLGLLGAALTFSLLELTFCFKIQTVAIIAVMGACAGFFVIPLTALFTTYSA